MSFGKKKIAKKKTQGRKKTQGKKKKTPKRSSGRVAARKLPAKATNAPESLDRYGRSGLHNVCVDHPVTQRVTIVETLIKKGSDVNRKDRSGWTPLHFAAQEGDADVAWLLLSAGADANSQDDHGNTPLWTAISNLRSHNRTKLIELLLASEANPALENNYGADCLGFFDSKHYPELKGMYQPKKKAKSKTKARSKTKSRSTEKAKNIRVPDSDYKWWEEWERLWKELVPAKGQADTVQGELLRCLGRLTDEAYRNGNINWDAGYRTMCEYVGEVLGDDSCFSPSEVRGIRADVADMLDYERIDTSGHGSSYYNLSDLAVRWCFAHPELIQREKNPKLHR